MRLTELEPEFWKFVDDKNFEVVDTIAEADGLRLLCPACFQTNGGPVGTHSVVCWEPNVPAHITPGPGRWTMTGSGFHDLSLVAGSSSVHLTGPGCGAHFVVANGEVTFC